MQELLAEMAQQTRLLNLPLPQDPGPRHERTAACSDARARRLCRLARRPEG